MSERWRPRQTMGEVTLTFQARIAQAFEQQLDANDAGVEAQQQLIENQKAELVRINSRYDAELAHLKKLWAGAQPGTGPAPITVPGVP